MRATLIEELEVTTEAGADGRHGLVRMQGETSSYLTERQSRSTNTLSRQQPWPSMLIWICRGGAH